MVGCEESGERVRCEWCEVGGGDSGGGGGGGEGREVRVGVENAGGGGLNPSEDGKLLRTTTSADRAGQCAEQALTDYYVRRAWGTGATGTGATHSAREARRDFFWTYFT